MRKRLNVHSVLRSVAIGSCLLGLSIGVVPVSMAGSAPVTTSVNTDYPLAKTIDWNAYKGKVVVIDFWASWCGPCRLSFPWMNDMQQKYGKDGLVFIAINTDSNKKAALDFLAQHKANFSVFLDPKGEVASAFKVEGMPSTYILDRNGNPAAKHIGFFKQKQSQYEAELVQLLKR